MSCFVQVKHIAQWAIGLLKWCVTDLYCGRVLQLLLSVKWALSLFPLICTKISLLYKGFYETCRSVMHLRLLLLCGIWLKQVEMQLYLSRGLPDTHESTLGGGNLFWPPPPPTHSYSKQSRRAAFLPWCVENTSLKPTGQATHRRTGSGEVQQGRELLC